MLLGIFSSQGQACVAGSRLFVHRSAFEELTGRVVAAAERLVIGDPMAQGTHMGPLISAEHRAAVESYVQLAADEGGHIRTGGERPTGPGLDGGFYYRPTVITGLDPASRVCQEEIFGPVLAVLPYDDEEELGALADSTPYGLACGIWTRDYRRAWRLARRIEAGTVWINTYKQLSASTPFGGVKESGIGREKGRRGHPGLHDAEEPVLGPRRDAVRLGHLSPERPGHGTAPGRHPAPFPGSRTSGRAARTTPDLPPDLPHGRPIRYGPLPGGRPARHQRKDTP